MERYGDSMDHFGVLDRWEDERSRQHSRVSVEVRGEASAGVYQLPIIAIKPAGAARLPAISVVMEPHKRYKEGLPA
jgi:hypothetical protein